MIDVKIDIDHVEEEDLHHPFTVVWGWSDEFKDWPNLASERFFGDKRAAREFAESKTAPKRPIWMFEVGIYDNNKGKKVRDWLGFWWNKPVKDVWDLECKAGYGVPAESNSLILVEYKRFKTET